MSLILISTITLVLMTYVDMNLTSTSSSILNMVDNITTVSFICEAALKIVGQGFAFGKNSYLYDPWS